MNLDWFSLKNRNESYLWLSGFVRWNKDEATNTSLMLIPYRFLHKVPAGLEVESISGERVIYNPRATYGEPGYMDDDERGGFLAYGIRVKKV